MEQSDAIAFNLLTEEEAQVLVISDQIDTATKKLLKILSGFNVFIFTTNLFFPFAKIRKKTFRSK